MFGIYFDPMYYLFALPGLLVIIWAQFRVKSTFSRYSVRDNARRLTGREAAEIVLRNNGVNDIRIEAIAGDMTDNFDPAEKVIRLSESVYNQTSIAAVGVAAHEAGHAVQHANGYAPIKVRTAIVPICNIGSSLGLPLVIAGVFFSITSLIFVGIIAFSLAIIFQLVTLPVEFNASKRAIEAINSTGILTPEELAGAKKVLSAAAMTYVAAMMQSLLILLYYIFRFMGRSRN